MSPPRGKPTADAVTKQSDILSTVTIMFDRLMKQAKIDQSELIQLLTDKFNMQLSELTSNNAALQCKVAILEERLANAQITMIRTEPSKSMLTNQSSNQPPNTTRSSAIYTHQQLSTPNGSQINPTTTTRPHKPTYSDTLRSVINGTATVDTSSRLKVAPKKVFPTKLFVTRLDPDTTKDDLISFLTSAFNLTFNEEDIEKRTTKYPTYSSFVITTTTQHATTLLDGSKWPERTLIKRFFTPKPNAHPNDTSDSGSQPESATTK